MSGIAKEELTWRDGRPDDDRLVLVSTDKGRVAIMKVYRNARFNHCRWSFGGTFLSKGHAIGNPIAWAELPKGIA